MNSNFLYGSSRSQRTISLSSCESELHSMVSAACDGIYIAACAQFIFSDPIHHIVFTDSSSARQLASRQGCGKVRHLSGKILWVQEKVADETFFLKQVSTIWNVADIGTKILSRQRLMLLMHETGLVYVATEDPVGTDELDRQVERSGNVSQIQRPKRRSCD